jgi:aminopeptidase N
MQHLDLDIAVNFEKHLISGSAAWTIENKAKAAILHLDTDGLMIDSVTVDGKKVTHSLDPALPNLGSRLNIPVEAASHQVVIWYGTSSKATALQWLEPSQTLGKKQPFLYTNRNLSMPAPGSPVRMAPVSVSLTVPA